MNTKKKYAASDSHHDALVALLKKDPDFAREYLRQSLDEDASDPAVLRLALRQLADAMGMTWVADRAGMHRENLYRALSTKSNPTVKTLGAICNAMGLKLTVEPIDAKAPGEARAEMV
jgi:probable addiction module antidote protein